MEILFFSVTCLLIYHTILLEIQSMHRRNRLFEISNSKICDCRFFFFFFRDYSYSGPVRTQPAQHGGFVEQGARAAKPRNPRAEGALTRGKPSFIITLRAQPKLPFYADQSSRSRIFLNRQFIYLLIYLFIFSLRIQKFPRLHVSTLTLSSSANL